MATLKNIYWAKDKHPGLLKNTYVVDNDVMVVPALSLLAKDCDGAVGVDTETTGLDPQIKPTRTRLLQLSGRSLVVVFDLFKLHHTEIDRIMAWLSEPHRVKVMHNAKFDLKFLMWEFGLHDVAPLFDTQLAAQLLDLGDRYGKHDLGYCYEHFLGVHVNKDMRHGWSGPLYPRQIIYASNDASHLPELRLEMIQRGREQGLFRAFRLEFEAVEPTAAMELAGFGLNVPKWKRLTEEVRKKRCEVEGKLLAALPPMVGDTPSLFDGGRHFNLDSNDELKERLKAIGVELPKMIDEDTEDEKDTLMSEKMAQIAGTHPAIPLVIEYSKLRKAETSYGKGFLRYINPHDGRVHADFRQIGTVTARYSAKEPPLHGIPKKSDHRECFEAADGWRLVWADYSQIELRILAELSGDDKLIQVFVDGKDLHEFTASEVFGLPPGAVVDDIQRRRAKDLNFGEVYGVGDRRFAEKSGLSLDEARRLRHQLASMYPGKARYLKNAAGSARANLYCETMSGKIIRFNRPEYPNTPEGNRKRAAAIGAIERHGKNYPIQGTSADITKTALRLYYNVMDRKNAKIVNCVHDEIVLEVKDGYVETEGAKLRECMLEAGRQFLRRVPVVVDVETNQYWRKAKAA